MPLLKAVEPSAGLVIDTVGGVFGDVTVIVMAAVATPAASVTLAVIVLLLLRQGGRDARSHTERAVGPSRSRCAAR